MRQRPRTLAAVLLTILGGTPLVCAQSVQQRTWEELARELPGKKVALVLPSGQYIRGRCAGLSERSLVVKSPPRKQWEVSREEVRSVLAVVRKGPWRALVATGLGLGAAVVAAAAVGSLREGPAASRQIGAIYGTAGAAAVGGYLIGRRWDGHSYRISIVPHTRGSAAAMMSPW